MVFPALGALFYRRRRFTRRTHETADSLPGLPGSRLSTFGEMGALVALQMDDKAAFAESRG